MSEKTRTCIACGQPMHGFESRHYAQGVADERARVVALLQTYKVELADGRSFGEANTVDIVLRRIREEKQT